MNKKGQESIEYVKKGLIKKELKVLLPIIVEKKGQVNNDKTLNFIKNSFNKKELKVRSNIVKKKCQEKKR